LHNIWLLIRRLSLKAVKVNGKWHTCEEWIELYYENKGSKQLHSMFNGRKVFDEARGELSSQTVADELGISKQCVSYHIKAGNIKSTEKGGYIVILRSDLEEFKAKREFNVTAKENNA
jgi:hypothetical protein